jgi:hypothetical protein
MQENLGSASHLAYGGGADADQDCPGRDWPLLRIRETSRATLGFSATFSTRIGIDIDVCHA